MVDYMFRWNKNNRKVKFIIPKSLFVILCLLFSMNGLYAQHPIENVKDSLSVYEDLFEKYLNEENAEKAIFYGKKLKDFWDQENYEKDTTYCSIMTALYGVYYNVGNVKESVSLLSGLIPTIKELYGSESIEYASSLGDLAVFYSSLGNYHEAIEMETIVLDIYKNTVGTDHPYYSIALNNLSSLNSNIGNYSEAINLCTMALDIEKRVNGSEHPNYANCLGNLAKYNYYIGNYSEAVRLGLDAINIQKRVLGSEHHQYMTSLNNLANYYYALGNYSEAISLGTEALERERKVLGTDNLSYATTLNSLALFNSAIGKYSDAIRYEKESLEIRKKITGVNNPSYAIAVNNLAGYYSELGEDSVAIQLCTESMEILKNVLGSEHPNYAMTLSNLASYYSNLGNYSEAISLSKESTKILVKVFGKDHPNYATSLMGLADYYSVSGNYAEAIRLGKIAMEIRMKVFGNAHPDYAASLNNLALSYYYYGDYINAIRWGTEAVKIRKTVLGHDHPDYAISLNNLALYNSAVGNYSESIHLGKEAMGLYKNLLGSNHPNYATILNNLANYFFAMGENTEAIRCGTEAMEIRKRVLGSEHLDYTVSLNNLANYYSADGRYTEAYSLYSEAIDIQNKTFGQNHPYYATSLNNLAAHCFSFGNYSEAIRIGTKAMESRRIALGVNNPQFATSLNNLACYNYCLKNYSEAISLGLKASEIRKDILGANHPDYAKSLSNLAGFYHGMKNYSRAYDLLSRYINISNNYILYSFSDLSSGLKKTLWTSEYSYIFNSFIPSVVFKCLNNESIDMLYDKTALFAKGILLNSSIGMRKLILESGDSILLSKYDSLLSNKSIYDKQLEKPIKDRSLDTDSLHSVIENQEMELARDSKSYGDFARNLRISWRDVRQNLDEDDIAIEFLDFPVYDTDSTMYVALTLKKGYDSPHMIPLFEKKQLDSIPESSYYTCKELYELIWSPLDEELSGVIDVYFSPSGELHRIGIEYLPATKEENICDRFSLHRLSSTRQLAITQDETKGENSVLYGGLRYDAVLDNSSRGITDEGIAIPPYLSRANVDSLALRDTYVYLPGTKSETDEIASYLSGHSMPYIYHSGNDGTEETFKQLDGTRPRMLHIATHGFYLKSEDARETDIARKMLLDNSSTYHEDMPMTRSGLLLSGCSPALKHESIPDGVEDGILTAQEISKLDLRGLDLVVLSACQTGLGDIISGEGVFGLQRGFKNAGARTIIMSLWKVDDSATKQLMSSFYGHYLDGMSKEKAFRLAQDELRKYNSDEQEKPDWAAFVMLDGINEYE